MYANNWWWRVISGCFFLSVRTIGKTQWKSGPLVCRRVDGRLFTLVLVNKRCHDLPGVNRFQSGSLASQRWIPCARRLPSSDMELLHHDITFTKQLTPKSQRVNRQAFITAVIPISKDDVCHGRTGIKSAGARQVILKNWARKNHGLGFGTPPACGDGHHANLQTPMPHSRHLPKWTHGTTYSY
jgi:hypothetical protein